MDMELNQGQKKALSALLSGENVFLTGGAGTGKTFLLNYFLSLPQNKRKNILICAPTGIAALQIGGATLHRTFKMPLKVIEPLADLGQINEAVKAAEVIVIDEISMCRIDAFQYVIRKILKAEKLSKKHKQIILVGDFFQLPPVVVSTKRKGQQYSDKDVLIENYGKIACNGFAFLSPCWRLANIKTVILTEIVRQKDPDFSKSLNEIRMGNANGLTWIGENCRKKQISGAITLCSSNNETFRINDNQLSALPSAIEKYQTFMAGEDLSPSEIPVPDILRLKVGCRVMSLVNDCSNMPSKYSNGSLGTVEELAHIDDAGDECLTIKFDNGNVVEIPKYKWEIKKYVAHKDQGTGKTIFEQETIATIIQFPIKIAYSITIHKSQGQTYDKVAVQPKRCFAPGQLYVALSRAVSIKNLYIKGELNSDQLICSDEVQHFYESNDFVDKDLLTAQKVMGSEKIQEEIQSLPFYSKKKRAKRVSKTTEAIKHRKNQKEADRSNGKSCKSELPIVAAFASASVWKKKSFANIIGILSHTDITTDNCLTAYASLSESKQHIAKSALN